MSRDTARPRRRPKRSSSSAIVDAIIDAAALLLDRDGFDGLTTNAISRVAGVSIGSLYQYFADKEAIVLEMARRVNTAAIGIATQEIGQLGEATPRDLLARIVDLSCSPAFLTLGARQAVLREVPLRWVLSEYRATHNAVRLVTTGFFSVRTTELRAFVPTHATFVSQHAIDGVVQALLLASPDALPDPRVQRELFVLLWSHLGARGTSLERPLPAATPAAPVARQADPELARRLAKEPSRRRANAPRLRAPSRSALATRERLVDAAAKALVERGHEGVTVRAITQAAGVAPGALYRHFPNVRDAIAAAAATLDTELGTALAERLRDPCDAAAILVDIYTGGPGDRDALRRALCLEIPRAWLEAATHEPARSAIETFARALTDLDPALRPETASLRAFFAFHAVRAAHDAYQVLSPPDVSPDGFRSELHALAGGYLDRAAD